MPQPVTIEARLDPVRLGKALHHMVRVPDACVPALGTPDHVRCIVGTVTFERALRRSPGSEAWCIWIGRALAAETGLQVDAPAEMRLEPLP